MSYAEITVPALRKDGDWIAADWPAPAHIVAGTTLRHAAEDCLPAAGHPAWLRQVHGNTVVTAAPWDTPPAADASVSGDAAITCVVRTADCLPVLFCHRESFVRAAAHAGWRGLAAGVLENTVQKMAVEPTEILAWLGPAISQPSFEVGGEVRDAFVSHDANAATAFVENARGRWQADLYALARQRLQAVGITAIYGGGECTFRDEARFFSFRRNPDCGRLLSFIAHKTP